MSYEEYGNQRKVINLSNGDTYEGGLQGKTKHGFGAYRYANGDVYEGDWENDEQQGNGQLKFADGSVYEG